jgi:DNA-binding PadR family transcriptional regulator
MSARHALLGLLLQGPAYPYQLADRLEERLGPAWSVDSGQLYKTIKQMEEEGLIVLIGGAMDDRDERRRFFAVTEEGVREFDRWFEKPTDAVRLHRRPLLLKVTLAGPERLTESLRQVDAYEIACTTRLKEIMLVRDEIPRHGLQVRADHLLLRVNLGADIAHLEGELKWARDARDVISLLLTREAIWPPGPRRLSASLEEARNPGAVREKLFDKMTGKHLRSTPGKLGGR